MNTILFDLDGTLLPMDVDLFMKIYFKEMSDYFTDLINAEELIKNIWASTEAMVKNTEHKTNEYVFMEDFGRRINGDLEVFKNRFYEFYDKGFLKVKNSIFDIPIIRESVKVLKDKGYKLVVATNPLFPLKAIHHRIRWAGFDPSEFDYVSCYETNHYCKPQLEYYKEVLKDIDKVPEDCLMVGNDVQEDLVAKKLGLKTFLVKNYMLHRTADVIDTDYEGTYEDFYKFALELPNVK